MSSFDLTAGITIIIVLCMQAASVVAIYQGALTYKDYLSLWTPMLTLVVGYWFRGAQGSSTQGTST